MRTLHWPKLYKGDPGASTSAPKVDSKHTVDQGKSYFPTLKTKRNESHKLYLRTQNLYLKHVLIRANLFSFLRLIDGRMNILLKGFFWLL